MLKTRFAFFALPALHIRVWAILTVCWIGASFLFGASATAAELDPLTVGWKYHTAGRYRQAIESYSEAIGINLDPYNAHLNRGLCYAALHDYPRAAADLKAAAQIKPNNPRPLQYLANVLCKTGDQRNALAALHQALKIAPARDDTHNSLAWFLATCPADAMRDGKQALAEARRACELSRWENPADIDTLAAAYAETGQFAEALTQQQRALALLKARDSSLANTRVYRQHRDLLLHHQPIRDPSI